MFIDNMVERFAGGCLLAFFGGGGGCAGGIGELPVELGCLELFEVGWCLAD